MADRKPGSRKAGDALPPQAAPILQKLGVVPDSRWATPTAGLQFCWGSDAPSTVSFAGLHQRFGLALNRSIFEQHLRDAALAAGAQMLQFTPLKLQKTPQGWKVMFEEGLEVQAAFLLDATGRPSWVARQMGISRMALDQQVALYREVAEGTGTPWIQVRSVPEGWWYICQLPHARSEMLFTTPDTSEYLQKVQEGGWKVAAASTSFSPSIGGERWLAVGDAAFTFDPIASQGISQALTSGYYAAFAARDLLQGKKEALMAYTLTLLKATDGFFREWTGIYQAEQRFKDAPYWRQRHRLCPVQLPWWEEHKAWT